MEGQARALSWQCTINECEVCYMKSRFAIIHTKQMKRFLLQFHLETSSLSILCSGVSRFW